jgi:hypothetical protein
MAHNPMTCRSNYLIGIDYDSIEEDKGHMTLHRAVSISELVEEVKDIMLNGCHFPQFPPEANPEVVYAYDLSKQEDADIYHIINNELIKSMEK